jgi:hypothetical protein
VWAILAELPEPISEHSPPATVSDMMVATSLWKRAKHATLS